MASFQGLIILVQTRKKLKSRTNENHELFICGALKLSPDLKPNNLFLATIR